MSKDSHPIKSPNTWVRILFVVLYTIFVRFIAQNLLLVVALVQAINSLFSKQPNPRLQRFGAGLAEYNRAVGRFTSYVSNEKPFPFGDWQSGDAPDFDPADQASSSDGDQPTASASPSHRSAAGRTTKHKPTASRTAASKPRPSAAKKAAASTSRSATKSASKPKARPVAQAAKAQPVAPLSTPPASVQTAPDKPADVSAESTKPSTDTSPPHSTS